jgi:hypothetical protein
LLRTTDPAAGQGLSHIIPTAADRHRAQDTEEREQEAGEGQEPVTKRDKYATSSIPLVTIILIIVIKCKAHNNQQTAQSNSHSGCIATIPPLLPRLHGPPSPGRTLEKSHVIIDNIYNKIYNK